MNEFITPDWPAPKNVFAAVTTRAGGVGKPPYDTMNLSMLVNDVPEDVITNRAILKDMLNLPSNPIWLKQEHTTNVFNAGNTYSKSVVADASFTTQNNIVCVVMTADCLPVLFTSLNGDCIAAAHAGWRGLSQGILENTVAKMTAVPENIIAWLGPAIGPLSFEVGPEVRLEFVRKNLFYETAFKPTGKQKKYMANIYKLARIKLESIGVRQVFGGGFDTMIDDRFFSYRDSVDTGRMASLIWLE